MAWDLDRALGVEDLRAFGFGKGTLGARDLVAFRGKDCFLFGRGLYGFHLLGGGEGRFLVLVYSRKLQLDKWL